MVAILHSTNDRRPLKNRTGITAYFGLDWTVLHTKANECPPNLLCGLLSHGGIRCSRGGNGIPLNFSAIPYVAEIKLNNNPRTYLCGFGGGGGSLANPVYLKWEIRTYSSCTKQSAGGGEEDEEVVGGCGVVAVCCYVRFCYRFSAVV